MMADTDPPRKVEQIEILPIDDNFTKSVSTGPRNGVVSRKGADTQYGSNAYWLVSECGSREASSYPAFSIPSGVQMGNCESAASPIQFSLRQARYQGTVFVCAVDLSISGMA